MRARRPQRADRRMRTPHAPGGVRNQRTVIVVGIALLLVIVGVGAYGFYDNFIAPTQVLAARIHDTKYTQGDLVNRLRIVQALNAQTGETLEVTETAIETILDMGEAEIIRRAAPAFNIRVSDDDIEARLRSNFFPTVSSGEEVASEQLEREYRENYEGFLSRAHSSDKNYRGILEELIYKDRLRDLLGKKVPRFAEQVELHWIKLLPPTSQAVGALDSPPPEEVLKRLETEDFADVARQVSLGGDTAGLVGWVPRDAFPFLNEVLFGSEDQEPIPHNEVLGPIITIDGSYIIKVTAGPENREISERMRERLKDRALETWLDTEQERGRTEGWYELNFDSELLEWVVGQLVQSAPRATRPAGQ